MIFYLADPGTMMLISLGATAAGAGVTALGKYQAGQATAAMYGSEADVSRKLGTAGQQAADVTEYAGYRAAEGAGLRARAGIGKQAVEYAAGNIAGGSTQQVRASQIALGVQGERETLAKYEETGYQERLGAAEKVAGAGRYAAAAGQAVTEGDIGALGSVVSGAGSVAGKWYDATKVAGAPSSAPYTG